MKTVGVIGSGVSGLASAARLAHQGMQVTVYEKDKNLGGRMNQIQGDGFSFDLGPTIVMMPEIYEQVFKDCGRNPKDYIPMEQLKSLFDLYYTDECITVPSDLTQLHQLLEGIEKDSAKGFFKYLSDIYERYIIARDGFITKSFRKKSDFWNIHTLKEGLKLKTFDSADHLIGKYISNDKIKKMLAFQTLYIGISPYQGPSLYSIIPMIEMVYGVWFMKGGMRTMVDALVRLCEEEGVTFKKETEVEEIVFDNNTATGVKVKGEYTPYDILLNTSDFPYAMNHLIKNDALKGKYTPSKINGMDYSCSAYLLYLGLDESLKERLGLHTIVFSDDFDKNIQDIFEGRFPEDPSVYVYAASTMDDTLAPKGKDGVYVLTPVPELKTGNIDWEDETVVAKYRKRVLDKIKRIDALKEIEELIIYERAITPKDFENRFNGYYGAAFGLRPTLRQSNHMRPQVTLPGMKNLYFAGASNHPGAGVPIVLTSAELAVEAIQSDMKG